MSRRGSSQDAQGMPSKVLRDIQDYLARHIVNQEDVSKAYIRYTDIREAWSGFHTVRDALYSANLVDHEITEIRDKLLRFISILVYIGAWDVLSDFRAQFYNRRNGGPLYHDCHLPLEDHQVGFLDPYILRSNLVNHQFLFIPAVIKESATVRRIDDRIRLPFEKVDRNFFNGAYGTVDRVEISPHYLKSSGGVNEEARLVACKRFHPRQELTKIESQRELENLQVLKESITEHKNIRLHLAILFHKGEHLIILPWAVHLDLEIFLLEGHSYDGKKIYEFEHRFPRVEQGAILDAVFWELSHVADALCWLHSGITTRSAQHENRICFAHMDLKPNNILIDEGPSPVGTWVLTDYGISAFKDAYVEDAEPSNLISVRDYFQNLTIDTTPRRRPGGYQPPEVEHAGSNFMDTGRGITREEGHAGRRGDIWSFGCIFSEVLAFALGSAALLKEFRKARKGTRSKTDYFYEEVAARNLRPDTAGRAYRVRPCITKWLRALPAKCTPLPKKTIDCCVETILEILITDGDRRPKADALLLKMNHVAKHVSTARKPGGAPSNCPLDRLHTSRIESNDDPPQPQLPSTFSPDQEIHQRQGSLSVVAYPNTPWSSHPRSQPDMESNRQNPILAPAKVQHRNVSTPPPSVPVGKGAVILPAPSIVRTDTVDMEPLFQGGSRGQPQLIPEGPPAQGEIVSTPALGPEREWSSIRSRTLSEESRRDLWGVLLDQDQERRVQSSHKLSLAELAHVKVMALSLCPSGERVAYLTKRRSEYEIVVYHLSLLDRTEQMQHSVSLPTAVIWQGLQISGDYIAAWGHTPQGNKQVYIARSHQSKVLAGVGDQSFASLITVAISKNGSLAILCSKIVIYTFVEAELRDDPALRAVIPTKIDHTFTHAAFNDDGSLLYAWEFGRPDDRLSVFRVIEHSHELSRRPESEGGDQSERRGSPAATVIPYNSYHGCIIWAQDGVFFPAQVRSTQRGSEDMLQKRIKKLPKAIAACVYNDHSLLVLEKSPFHAKVKELRIAGGAMQDIEKARTNEHAKIRLKSVPDKGTQMRAVAVPGTRDLIIVICMPDGKIELIPLTTSKKGIPNNNTS